MSDQIPTAASAPGLMYIQDILRRTQPWARLMAIIWLIGCAIMVCVGIVAGLAGIAANRPQIAALFVLYPAIGVIYFFPAMYVRRFANRARDYAESGQLADLEAALDAQRSFWKFFGIMTLIGVAVAVVGVLSAGVIGFLFASRIRG
jgi:hypothetical protein